VKKGRASQGEGEGEGTHVECVNLFVLWPARLVSLKNSCSLSFGDNRRVTSFLGLLKNSNPNPALRALCRLGVKELSDWAESEATPLGLFGRHSRFDWFI
jgi:hypothetical protein